MVATKAPTFPTYESRLFPKIEQHNPLPLIPDTGGAKVSQVPRFPELWSDIQLSPQFRDLASATYKRRGPGLKLEVRLLCAGSVFRNFLNSSGRPSELRGVPARCFMIGVFVVTGGCVCSPSLWHL